MVWSWLFFADVDPVDPTPGDTLQGRLLRGFRWVGDASADYLSADLSGWWTDADIVSELGWGLGALHRGTGRIDAVIGPESSGLLVGSLVASALGTGLIAVRKRVSASGSADSDRWHTRTSPPDYRDRNLVLGVRHRHLQAGMHVLFVDDWIDTGGQAQAVQGLVADAGAHWVGAAVIVDALEASRRRRELNVQSLLHVRDL